MFLDKFIKKPEPEPEVQHSLKDDEPTMIDEPDHLEITGDYAHWYMLYGRGYTIYQDTDYVYRELIKKSNIGCACSLISLILLTLLTKKFSTLV